MGIVKNIKQQQNKKTGEKNLFSFFMLLFYIFLYKNVYNWNIVKVKVALNSTTPNNFNCMENGFPYSRCTHLLPLLEASIVLCLDPYKQYATLS